MPDPDAGRRDAEDAGERPSRVGGLRVFRHADQRVVPWRNGRGSTTEIAIHPPGATVRGGFDWRVSQAVIAEDGPFSVFPGIDRTLVLAEGAGVDLQMATGTTLLCGRHAMAQFPGEAEVHARLHAGPVRDLNLMVRRTAYGHEAAVVSLQGPTPLGGGHPVIAVALGGEPVVEGLALLPGEAVVAEGTLTASGAGTILVARLSPR